MARIRFRIRRGKIVEPVDLPEEVEGWLEPAEPFEAASAVYALAKRPDILKILHQLAPSDRFGYSI